MQMASQTRHALLKWTRLLLCASAAVLLAPGTVAQTPRVQSLAAKKVAAFKAATGGKVRVGISAVDLASGRQLIPLHDDELFIPASNQKLLVSALALLRLGADYRFVTSVFLLPGGDLLVVGGFDPTLGDPAVARAEGRTIYAELDRWTAAFKKIDPAKFSGTILVSGVAGKRAYRHGDWPRGQNHTRYQAPVARLSFYNNCFGVTFAVSDGRVTPAVTPQSRFIKVRSSVRLASRHIWSFVSNRDDSVVSLRGTAKTATREPYYVAANNPPLLAGRVLAERMIRGGLTVTGQVRTIDADTIDRSKAQLICRTTTPLATVMRRANKDSVNMAAECILLRAGDGTWPGSANIMTAVLTEAFGLPEGSLVVRDGCGLSRKDLASPAAITKLLAGVARRKDARLLVGSLSRNGVDGTLRRRMTASRRRERVAAKTGYIRGVSCLSGYVLDTAGRPAIAFSMLVNDMPGRIATAKDLQDELCAVLIDASDGR